MANTFLILFPFYWWLIQLFYKLTDLDKPDNVYYSWACNIKNKFLGWFFTSLFECQFCMESHIGFILSLGLVFYYDNLELIILGYAFAGLRDIIKRFEP
jgi:hypothetical protein